MLLFLADAAKGGRLNLSASVRRELLEREAAEKEQMTQQAKAAINSTGENPYLE